jgi:hypothetical protein
VRRGGACGAWDGGVRWWHGRDDVMYTTGLPANWDSTCSVAIVCMECWLRCRHVGMTWWRDVSALVRWDPVTFGSKTAGRNGVLAPLLQPPNNNVQRLEARQRVRVTTVMSNCMLLQPQ